jgi:hypothetical protein
VVTLIVVAVVVAGVVTVVVAAATTVVAALSSKSMLSMHTKFPAIIATLQAAPPLVPEICKHCSGSVAAAQLDSVPRLSPAGSMVVVATVTVVVVAVAVVVVAVAVVVVVVAVAVVVVTVAVVVVAVPVVAVAAAVVVVAVTVVAVPVAVAVMPVVVVAVTAHGDSGKKRLHTETMVAVAASGWSNRYAATFALMQNLFVFKGLQSPPFDCSIKHREALVLASVHAKKIASAELSTVATLNTGALSSTTRVLSTKAGTG